jgi:hypothetical protein
VRLAADLAAKLAGLVLLGTAVWLWFWRSEGWAALYLLVFAALALLEGGKWMARRNRGKAPDGPAHP